jgi:uncharacterized membrane protein
VAYLTQGYLKRLLHYNADTGIFTWKIRRGGCSSNNVAGALSTNGYVTISIGKHRYRAHRLAWLYIYGVWTKEDIDHINHIRTDNRINNLRVVSHSDNCKNSSMRTDNTSNVVGVSYSPERKKWCAYITSNYKTTSLGRYKDFFEAVCARKSAENSYNFHTNHGTK